MKFLNKNAYIEIGESSYPSKTCIVPIFSRNIGYVHITKIKSIIQMISDHMLLSAMAKQ